MTTAAIERTKVAPLVWSLDQDRSSVEFTVKTMWGLIPVRGCFDRFTGSYEVGQDESSIELTIEAESVGTGNTKRDEHLRSADFFDVEHHGQLRFRSTRVEVVGDGVLHVVGTLEVAGTVEPLELDANVQPVGHTFAVEATTSVDPQRFGMSTGLLGMIRGPATLHVRALLQNDD